MNINITKIIKYLLITVLCISLLLMAIVSQDEHHLESCHEEHCAKCQIIQIAQNFINIVHAVMLLAFIGFLVWEMLNRIKKENFIALQKTLIFDKVQMNE